MPPVTSDAPFTSRELAIVVTEHHLDCLASSSRKKASGKKRKAASYSTSTSSQKGPKVELINIDEHTSTRKVRRVSWQDLEPMDAPTGTDFDLENIDSLWYRQLDYSPFLR